MGRAGYSDDLEPQDLAMWRGRVASATRGKRGQKMLRDLRDAMDLMPDKRLVHGQLQTKEGDVCALGCVAAARGVDLTEVQDCDDEYVLRDFNEELAIKLDVAECLVREIEYENDESGTYQETPEERWKRMRQWVGSQVRG